MRQLLIFAMCLMLLSLSFAQGIGSEVSMGKAEAKAVAIIDSQVVFKLDKNNPLQNVSATKLNSKSYEIKIGKDKLFEFEVKNQIDFAKNKLLDCTGGYTCDFTITLKANQAMRFDVGQITGGWLDGQARVQKVFYLREQIVSGSYTDANGTTQTYSSTQIIEETDLSTLTVKPSEDINLTIRFERDELKEVDIYPVIYGNHFTDWSIWGTGGTEYTTLINGTNYTIHVFTSSGTFEALQNINNASVLVVGGGGSGGSSGGGGGGAGGLLINWSKTIGIGNYSIVVGAGGSPNNNGNNSVFDDMTAIGGGKGGHWDPGRADANAGGSGGGAGLNSATGSGAGTQGQGYAGGNASIAADYSFGGGGGASEAGGNAPNTLTGGAGGNGLELDINGSATYYAGGGGGGTFQGNTPGSGGLGGGGTGGKQGTPPTDGTDGLGSGGGGEGGGYASVSGGAGGDGIVIIRYLTAFPQTSQSPTITPSPAFTNTTLNFNSSVSNIGSNNITAINYTIFVNGSSYLANQKTGNFSDGQIVSLHNQSGFAKGSTLILQVISQLSNGTWLNATNSSQLSISNTNPALSSLSFTANGSAFQLGPVQANITFQDIDGDPMTCTYNWFKNGANQTSLAGSTACTNGTQFTLNAPSPFTVGDNWSIRVWANDSTNTSAINESSNTTIQNYTSNLLRNTSSPQYDIYSNLHQLNLTMLGGSSMNATLTIDNQTTVATSSNVGSAWVFNSSQRPAQVSIPTTKTANWTFTTILANGSSYAQTISYTFQVIPGGLLACNATITTPSINYTIRDYQTGALVSASFSNLYTSDTVSRSASGSASAYGWCIAPYNASIDVSFTETYSATGYSTIQLTRAITASNSSQNLTIYLFNSSNTKSTQLKVLQAPALQVPGAYITVEAYQAPSNYSFITSCNTDVTGTCLVSLIPNIQEYRYNITISGQTFSFGPESLACPETAALCFRTFTIGSSGVIDYFNNPINGNCSFSNSTSILTCSSNDTSNTITQGNLSLYLVIGNNSNSTVSTLLCNQTYSGSAGTLQCSVPTDDGDYYFAFYGTDSANAAYYFDSGWITDRRDTAQNFGYEGLLIAFIFIICVAAVGFYSLVVSIILMDIAILAMQLMGIVQFGWEIVVGFWLISAMLIYKLRM